MNEDKNNKTAAAAEATVDSIKKLLDTVGNDDDLKQKLEDILAALTGKKSDAAETKETPEKKEEPSAAVEEEDSADEDDDDDDDVEFTSGSDLSDIFTEDALAGMVIGFVAGAAVVGGGVLIHKLISK
jgi:hypothetical protein